MQVFLKMLSVVLLMVTVVLFYFVWMEPNVSFDAHGIYVSPDGFVYRESQSEQKLFRFLFSGLLLFLTAYFAFRRKSA